MSWLLLFTLISSAADFVRVDDPVQVQEALAGLSDPTQHTVQIVHVSGQPIYPKLASLVSQLRESGFHVQADLVDLTEFEKIEAAARTHSDLSSFFVLPEVKRNFKERKRALFHQIQGITFFRHFKGLFQGTSRMQRFATLEALLIANPILQFAINSIPASASLGVNHIGPSILMSSWIVAYILNLRQIASFKGQMKILDSVPEAIPGDQLQLRSSAGFMFASTFVQELIFNGLLTISMFGVDDLSVPILLNSIANVPLSTFARTPFEAKVSDLISQEAEARARGDLESANRLHNRAVWIERISSNYLIPALKLLSLVAPVVAAHQVSLSESAIIYASWLGLFVMGGVGGIMKLKQYFRKTDPPPAMGGRNPGSFYGRTLIQVTCKKIVDAAT